MGRFVLAQRPGQQADDRVESGDRIRIGDTVYEFIDDRESAPVDIDIPGYKVIERIGSGGMGTVYKARQLSMDRIVALKVLNEKYSADEQFIQRFIREARAAGRLSHPNVIHVHDVSEANGIHYFSMEYVDGTTVKRLLKDMTRLDVDKALDIVLQTARALEYAHENEVIHRDVKPDNIMLSKDGVVKLADLGIAKTFDESADEPADAGGRHRIFGTPHYMAPEQALGHEMDARADVYSLGATFYHMLTGSTPFQGKTVTDVLKAHIQSNLPAIHESAPEAPNSVVFIVERMMAKDKTKRYPSMGKLIEDIEKVMADREAEIERLAAGESSIIPAVKRRATKKRARDRAEREQSIPDWLKWLIGGGVVLGLALLFVGTVYVARAIQGSPSAAELLAEARQRAASGRTTEARRLFETIVADFAGTPEAAAARRLLDSNPPGPPQPEAQTPVDFIKSVEAAEAGGDLDGALAEMSRFREKFPGASPEDRLRADEVARRIGVAIKERQEQAARAAIEQCDRYAVDNPNDFEGLLERLRAVARGFSETGPGREADRRARDLAERLDGLASDRARRDFAEAEARSAEARTRRDYDSAIQAYRAFLALHDEPALAGEARAAVAKLEGEVKAAFEEMRAQAMRQLGDRQYGQALLSAQRFAETYVSVTWRSETTKLRQSIEKSTEGAFEAERKKALDLAKAFEFNEAAAQYALLGSQFRGTRWADLAAARVRELDAERKLVGELVRRVNAQGAPVRTPFPPPNVPASLEQESWNIMKADGRWLTLVAGRQNQFQIKAPWGGFSPDQMLAILDLYFPKPTAEEHTAIAYMCQERGLTDRAQWHFEAAASSAGP